MPFTYSTVGDKLSGHSGIVELMDDLGHALAEAGAAPMHMMGGGNPAHIPAMQDVWRRRLAEIVADPAQCDRMLTNYDPPAGNTRFREAFAACLRQEYGWPLSSRERGRHLRRAERVLLLVQPAGRRLAARPAPRAAAAHAGVHRLRRPGAGRVDVHEPPAADRDARRALVQIPRRLRRLRARARRHRGDLRQPADQPQRQRAVRRRSRRASPRWPASAACR